VSSPEPKGVALPEPLKAAFLGGSYLSAIGRTHRIAIELDNHFELIAGCFSLDRVVNERTAQEYGIPREHVYNDLDMLLQSEMQEIDVIVVLTPTDQHAGQVARCLDAGIPVICEKSLATSSDEVRDIKMAKESSDGFLLVTYNYLGYPMLRELRHMVRQGELGRIQQVHVQMPQEGFERLTENGDPIVPQEWRLRDSFVPTISLDLGVHLHMLTYYLTGEKPLSVVASSSTYGNFGQIVDNVSCIAKYSGGVTSNIWYSKTALGERNGLKVQLFGDRGSAKWVQEYPENLHIANNQGSRWVVDRASPGVTVANQSRYTRFKAGHPAGFIEAFANYYCDAADALTRYRKTGRQEDYEDCFGVEEAYEGLRLLESIAASSVSERWESLQ
jgi:predicted dehydrogenase